MIKLTHQSDNGTSFHDSTIRCSVADLIRAIGEPQESRNDGSDKVNFCWTCETSKGDIFTIYDWKYYRSLREDEMVEWHIGGYSKRETEAARSELQIHLSSLVQ
jgi:hypothetical protein